MPDLMDELVKRYGYIVTLETPRYSYSDDLEDTGKKSVGDSKAILQPKTNALFLTVPVSSTITADKMAAVLSQLVQKQSASPHGGHYRVEQDDQVFHIIPTEVRDRSGNWASQKSVFDTPVSLAKADRSSYDSLVLVLNAIGEKEHFSVRPFQLPAMVMHNSHSVMEARDEPARQVITRILSATNNKLTWRAFFYEPMQSYLFSVFLVSPSAKPPEMRPPTVPVSANSHTATTPASPSSAPPSK